MESFDLLVKSIPEWQTLLDGLSGKIARRQKELAEADDDSRPSTRSIRHKGSTESLRPKDNDPITPVDFDEFITAANATQLDNDASIPTLSFSPNIDAMPPPTNITSQPSQHNFSNRLKGAAAKGLPALTPPVARKRKTESLASAESGPKHRTRSMIIVYYDSAVQSAFENLVKHISSSRNCMRKGKMAERMADMRRMADLDSVGDELAVDDSPEAATRGILNGSKYDNDMMAATTPGDEDDDGLPLPALKFVSTRRMGAMREVAGSRVLRPMPGMPYVRRAGQAGLGSAAGHSGSTSSIFDELDKGLEWCQSMCEHAAHQFLRDGQCSSEIAGIKSRLEEVWKRAEEEAKRETKKKEESRTNDDPIEITAEDARTEDKGGVAATKLKSEPQLPRTIKQIQIRRAAEKMIEKAEKPAHKSVQRPLDKMKERSLQQEDSSSAGKGDGAISVDTTDILEADDDDVMDEDDLRNEYAAIIARNSNYRRRQNIY